MRKLTIILGLVVAGAVLAGCASQIMESYVGRDVTEVILDYGPPINVMELPDGRTAFQWRSTAAITTPVTTNVYGYGNYATATSYGGTTSTYDCLYTLYAQPNRAGSFTIVGFRPPSMMCE